MTACNRRHRPVLETSCHGPFGSKPDGPFRSLRAECASLSCAIRSQSLTPSISERSMNRYLLRLLTLTIGIVSTSTATNAQAPSGESDYKLAPAIVGNN